eukprot:c25024_g1_i1 orf=991-1491(+)
MMNSNPSALTSVTVSSFFIPSYRIKTKIKPVQCKKQPIFQSTLRVQHKDDEAQMNGSADLSNPKIRHMDPSNGKASRRKKPRRHARFPNNKIMLVPIKAFSLTKHFPSSHSHSKIFEKQRRSQTYRHPNNRSQYTCPATMWNPHSQHKMSHHAFEIGSNFEMHREK